MLLRFQTFIYRCVAMTRMTACLIAALTLLTFPVQHMHQAANHFRTPEVRNSIERHTFLNETRSDCSCQIIIEQDRFSPLILINSGDRPAALETQGPILVPRISRLLLRLKLRPRSSSDQDSFI